MKKTLLFVALSLGFYGTSQSLTQANEAPVGTTQSMHLCDSFTTVYDGITGAGVTWDYTGLTGYTGEFRDLNVVDPATTTYASDFAGADRALEMGTQLTTYFSSTASQRVSQGFVYSEPSLGDVLAMFDVDDELVATYPFAISNTVTDIFSGTLEFNFGGPQSLPATGNSIAMIDGEGTLDMPGGVSLTGVIRYKIIDTSWATIPFLGDLEFIRQQYEYYDHTVSNLPVLVMSTIIAQNVGQPPIAEETLVLSFYTPDNWVGITELETLNIGVYPNPTTGNVKVTGNMSNDAVATVFDQSGRLVLDANVHNGSTLDFSQLENGMYIVRITDNGITNTKNVVKK